MWQGWINGFLGIWLVVSPFIGASRMFYSVNDFVVGIVIGILGLTVLGERSWQGWLSFWLGVWLFVATFIPALHAGSGVLVNNIVSGLIGMIAGFGASGPTKEEEMPATRDHDRRIDRAA